MTREAFICHGLRTPIGRYGGALSAVRADDLAATPLRALARRHERVDWEALDDVVLGCANQAGEDNRNVARMALLLAGLPVSVPGVTVNRLCGSGLDAIATAARSIRNGEADLVVAGGAESMSRAPFVVPKPAAPFARNPEIADSTIGWRFVNPVLRQRYGTDSMPQTAENLAEQLGIRREDQDAFAWRSQVRARTAAEAGRLAEEIVPVLVPRRKASPLEVDRDEHPRPDTTLEGLAALSPLLGDGGTVTAGNASGVNDGACATIVASEEALRVHGLEPAARVVGAACAGVEPRVMGIGPVPATRRLLARHRLTLEQMDVIELNEAFASQCLAVLRAWELPDDAEQVNPNGGAIALGHPLGMSGARLAVAAARELHRRQGRYALCTMCVGVGQGIAMVLERT